MPHGSFYGPTCVYQWVHIYSISIQIQLYCTLKEIIIDLVSQNCFYYANLKNLFVKMGRSTQFSGMRKRKHTLFKKNNQLAKKIKIDDFNTLNINNDNYEPMPSTSSEQTVSCDIDDAVKLDDGTDTVVEENGHRYNTRSSKLCDSSRLECKTDEQSLLEGMRLLNNTKVIAMYNEAIKKHFELRDHNRCDVPEFCVKEIKWGMCWKQIVYCTKCDMQTGCNKLYDEVETGKPGPKPAVTNLNLAVSLQDTSIGITKISQLVTAMDVPSPTLRAMQISANKVAEATVALNKADMSQKIKKVLDMNQRNGVENGNALSVGLDTRYNTIGITSRKKPGQASSQGIGLAVETMSDKKYIVGVFMQNKLCWTGAWLRNKGFDVKCPGGHADCTANLAGAAPISEYEIGKNIGRGFNLERVLVKYATTDGDGRSAEGLNDALKVLTPLWRVERLADTIHLGQSQFKYAMKAAFSPSMFSPMGRCINQTKLYQYKKGFSLDVKARCHLVFNAVMKEMGGNITKIKKVLPSIMEAILHCYDGDCSGCKKYSYSCNGGESKNWWTRSVYLQQYGIHALDMDEKDKLILKEIVKMKLSVSAVESMRLNTNTNKNEAANRGLSVSLPKNVNFSRNGNGRAHAAVHRMNNGVGESTIRKIENVGGHLSPRAKRTLQHMQHLEAYHKKYQKDTSVVKRELISKARQVREHYNYKGAQADYRKGQLDPRPNIPMEGEDHAYTR